MPRKYTKKSDYWTNTKTSDRQIRLIFNKNRSLINETTPDKSLTGMDTYELFKVQVLQKARDGKSIPSAAKEVLNARQYVADPSRGALYKQKVSLSFSKMGYLKDTREVKINLQNKKSGETVEFTRKARYTSGINTIDVYYSNGYKQKVILVNGVLTTSKSTWTM